MTTVRAIAVLAAALTAAACQPLPQPLKPADKAPGANLLLELGDTAGVFVAGIDGAPPRLAALVDAALVDALLDHDLPASTDTANRRSNILHAALRPGVSADELVLDWTLTGEAGGTTGAFEQAVVRAHWDNPSAAFAERIAAEVAGRVVALLRDKVDAPPPLPPLVVAPVAGAPGDGDAVLASAMRRALRAAGLAVSEDVGEDALLVLGSVYMEPAGETEERVEVTWTVLRPDGSEVGRVDQGNRVPRGALDRRWGRAAIEVATGGAEGVAALLRSAQARESP